MMKFIKLIFILTLITSINPAFASYTGRTYLEKDYQQAWCSSIGGKQEVVLNDRARVDCVTDKYAIEFDFANKWGEAIGQSLYYGTALKKSSGIVLIMEDYNKDKKYLDRIRLVSKLHNITVWIMTPNDINKKTPATAIN